MLNAQLAELEQEFRKQWHGYQPQAYSSYLEQVAPEDEAALLARLLAVELEYAYQPPNLLATDCIELDEDERVEPRVMLFLHRFPQLKQHRELLIQLVMLEFALRLRFDPKTPNYDSYLDLCPHEKERVGGMMQVMEEKLYRLGSVRKDTGEKNQDDSTIAEGDSPKKISLSQLPCSLGYFLLTDVIGQGGMGTVYSAVDLRSAAHVAVKIIHRADSWSVYRFIEEFTWLSTLNHPNVVKLYDTFSEGDHRYFSMEVVEGKAIRQWFAGETSENRWDQLRHVLSQAALAVAFLHDHEVLHRDIKSSNLMITGRGRAVLLDLGLASRVRDDRVQTRPLEGQQLVGTLHYLSPEALRGLEPTEASDWYSFGVMMYETLTGNFPPVRIDMQAPLDSGERFQLDHVSTHEHLAACPEDLATLCLEMLRTDPAERPQATEIIRRLGSDVGQPIPFAVCDSDFVGREEGWEFLCDGLRQAEAGKAVVRLVRGESGIGKTSLLNRWIKRELKTADLLRLNIRCHSQDHTPLRALNLLVQELVTSLSQHPAELWLELARGGGEEIIYTFPQMERLKNPNSWPTQSKTADSMEGVARRAAGLHALLGWLKGLSTRIPVVITIDDAQWADHESGRILSHLLRPSSEFAGLIVLVDQGAEVDSPFLRGLLEQEALSLSSENSYSLPPLTRSQCEQLLNVWSERLKIQLTPAVAQDILKRSGGSPFLLQELLRSYVNYIVRHRLSDETWLSGSQKSAGVLHNRFSMLPPVTEKVLQFLAVSPQPLGIHQLQTASRILPGQLLAELNHLSGQGWIRWNGTTLDSELEISHERFREVVLQAMMEDRLQRRHYRLARMLSSEVPPPWRRIAHHYSEAHQYREAAACYMEGARTAARRLSFAEALWMLERAFHPQAQRTEQETRAAQRLKADCLAGHGNSLAAAQTYESLASAAGEDQLLMQCLAGEQWIRAGRLNSGLHNLRTALNRYGALHETSDLFSRIVTAWRNRATTRVLPTTIDPRSSGEAFNEIEQCLNRISGPLAFLDGHLGGRLIRSMFKQALERGTSFDRAIAFMRHALVLACSIRRDRVQAIQWIRLARRMARHSGSQNARALSQVCMFLWHSWQGRFADSLRYAERAQGMYQAQYASDTWETGFVCWVSLAHLWYLARLKELCAQTDSYRQDAAQRTDTMWTYWMHVNAAHIADLVRDDVPAAQESLDQASAILSDELFEMPQVLLWISQIRQLLYEGDPRAAREKLLEHWSRLEASSVLRIAYCDWLLRYLRVSCDLACAASDRQHRSNYLKDAQHQIQQLKKLDLPAFITYAEALQLVVDAANGRMAPSDKWQQILDTARTQQLVLLVIALHWHAEVAFPNDFQPVARQYLIDQGAVNPERLMNIILPLCIG